ncbi:sensor histidine kinase [Geodermatophilus amargosae]|uniref:sensor histidine kinase n=1 Tax=Geodermatophilus amargosae TaxID=1296565 RepID=UPI0015879D36|nr:sensor histidine kinase [Geodermatophilus amargosae]
MATGDWRPRTTVGARLLVGACLTGYVLAVYWVLVLGGGTLLGSRPPSLPLAVSATAVVAVTFEPVLRILSRRWLTSPYDVLAEFSSQVVGVAATAELAPRMARLVAEATGSRRVEVWLRREDSADEDLAARWPSNADPIPSGPGVQRHEVRHAGEAIGHIVRDTGAASARLTPVEQRLLDDLLASAGLALRNLVLTTGLQRHIEQTVERSIELQASRQRIVATSDAARRHLERDIHDGAQQHLVALTVNLSLAATLAGRDPVRAAALVADLRPATEAAVATLEQLSRGVYPRLLAEAGLAEAMRAAWATSPLPVRVVDRTDRRFPAEVESAAYFCCLEAVQNAVKHAQPRSVQVRLVTTDSALCFEVHDDGIGFDPTGALHGGAGLANMRDRVESLGGTVTVDSRPDAGTRVRGRIPIRATPGGSDG